MSNLQNLLTQWHTAKQASANLPILESQIAAEIVKNHDPKAEITLPGGVSAKVRFRDSVPTLSFAEKKTKKVLDFSTLTSEGADAE